MPTPIAMMTNVAALLNDQVQSVFTTTVQLPYFNMALNELRTAFEQHNIAYMNETANVNVTAGQTGIGDTGQSALPTGLVEIQELFERTQGSSESFSPMTRVEFLPALSTTSSTSAIIW